MTETGVGAYSNCIDSVSAERGPQNELHGYELLTSNDFDPIEKADSASILDPQETTSLNQLKPTYRAQFLEPCQDEYDATCEAYAQIYPHPSNWKRYNLENCRRHAFFAMDRVSGDVKIMTDSCRERWCPMCASQKASFTRHSVQSWIESLDSPRFLTLTLKHCEEPLLPQIEFLQDAFRRLRMRIWWKRRVFGGIWFLQVHRSKEDGCWHPHLHILLDGKYMEEGKLSELWDVITWGSTVVYITRIHNPEDSARYVARYSARPAKFADMPLADRIEMIEAMKGKRLSGTFGTAKCVTLTPPKIKDGADWMQIGHYDTLVKDAKSLPAASLIIKCWLDDCPITEEEFFAYTGREVNPEIPSILNPQPIQYLLDFYNS